MRALLERYGSVLVKHRALFIALSAAAVLAVVIAFVLQRDTRAALFAEPLDEGQVSEVVTQLASWNVPFIATVDNVRVEGSQRSVLLLRLALIGVPHTHITTSAEALATIGPLTPESVLDARRLTGLAGDIALSLRGMDGVSDARVIIAPATQSLFPDDPAHEAGASVRLSLRPGARLSSRQIEGIRTFVAAAVPGLEGKRVAVLDDRGVVLEGSSGATETVENDQVAALQTSLQSALDTAFGAGAVIVRVHASYDMQTREMREIRRAPLGDHPISTTLLDERFSGERKRYGKTQSQEDRGSDLREEQTRVPPGKLAFLSVSVIADARRGIDLEKLRAISAAAVGLAPQRGDVLSVQEVRFAASPVSAPRTGLVVLGMVAMMAPMLIMVLGALVALRWGAGPAARMMETFVKSLAVRRTQAEIVGLPPAHVRGVLNGEPAHTAAAIISALPTATATAVLEMYSPEERAAIVLRMRQAVAPVIPDYQALLRRA